MQESFRPNKVERADFNQPEVPDTGNFNGSRTKSICIRGYIQQEHGKRASVGLLVQFLMSLCRPRRSILVSEAHQQIFVALDAHILLFQSVSLSLLLATLSFEVLKVFLGKLLIYRQTI